MGSIVGPHSTGALTPIPGADAESGSRASVWLPVMLALAIFAAGVATWHALKPTDTETLRLRTEGFAEQVRGDIGAYIRGLAGSLQRQAERTEHNDSEANFRTDTGFYLRDLQSVLGMRRQVADGAPQQVARAPLDAATLFALSPSYIDRWAATSSDYLRQLSAPQRLPDGRAVYFLAHERIGANGARQRFETALDASRLLDESIDIDPDYAIDVRDGASSVYTRAAEGALETAQAYETEVDLLGRHLALRVTPTQSAALANASSRPALVLVGAMLLALFVGGMVRMAFMRREQRERDRAANIERDLHADRRLVAELARDTAQRQLGSILESITDAFVIVDGEWRYVYVNPTSARRIGIPAPDLVGCNFWDVRPQFRASPEATHLRRAMAERVSVSFEYRAHDSRYFLARVYPHLDGLALYFQDITEQHDIAVRLDKSQELLSLSQSIALIGGFERNPDGSEIWSEQLSRIVGEDDETDLLRHAPFLGYVHEGDRGRVAAMENELSGGTGETETRARIVTVGGEVRPVRVRMRRRAGGPSTAFVGTVQDIGEQDRTERALGASLQHSRGQSAKFRALNRAMLLISARLGHAELHQVLVDELREAVGARVATLHFSRDDAPPPLISVTGRYVDPDAMAEILRTLDAFARAQDGRRVLRLDRDGVLLHACWRRLVEQHPDARALEGLLSVPLHDRMGQRIGYLQASDCETGKFDADDEAISVQFAQIASIALGWGRMIDDLRAAEATLSEQLEEVSRSRALLAGAEQVARFGSWEIDTTQSAGPDFELSEEAARVLGVEGDQRISLDSLCTRVHSADVHGVRGRFAAFLGGDRSEIDLEFRVLLGGGARWMHMRGRASSEVRGPGRRIVGSVQDVTDRQINALQDRLNAQTFASIAAGRPIAESLAHVIDLYESRFPLGVCSLLLLDSQQRLHTAAAPRLPAEYNERLNGTQIGSAVGSCGTAAWRGSRVIVRDTQSDPVWKNYAGLAAQFNLMACWSTPIFDGAGKVLGTFAVYYHETREPTQEELECVDRAAAIAAVAIMTHLARQRVEDREQRFRSLFTYVPEAIFALDMQGRIVDCNEAAVRMTGFSRNDLLQSALSMTVTPEDRPRFETHLRRAAGGAMQQIELHGQRPDGTRYITMATKTPIIVNGELAGIFSIVRDVTGERLNQVALEDALRTARAHNRELEEFAYVASHDLQEPLRKVRAFGDRLRVHLAEGADTQTLTYIERMRVSAERMQQLIDDLLAYSRVAKRDATVKRVALDGIVEGVLADLETRIDQVGAEVDVGALPVVLAEETQMRQLFQNLISNALKFTRPGVAPQIGVRAETFHLPEPQLDRRAWVRIVVRDNGIGFDNKYAERIFGAFQRLHGRSDYEGSGIGLAIVRRIVERHGGRINAEGVVDEGATFTIEIPQGVVEDARAPAREQLVEGTT